LTATTEQSVGGVLSSGEGPVEPCLEFVSILTCVVVALASWLKSSAEYPVSTAQLPISTSCIEVSGQCATLPAQGQRVNGPGVKMARRRYQKGSVRRRGKRWKFRWREDVVLADGTIKRELRSTDLGSVEEFPTKRLAQREAESLLARVNRLDYRPVRRATFGEFVEHWENQVVDLLKPSTAKVMKSHLHFHLVPAFGRVRLDEIGQEQVQAFVGKLAKGRSRHTILNVLGTLASVLKIARKWGYTVAGFQQIDLVIPSSKPGKPGRFFRRSKCVRFFRLLRSRGTQCSLWLP